MHVFINLLRIPRDNTCQDITCIWQNIFSYDKFSPCGVVSMIDTIGSIIIFSSLNFMCQF